MSVTFFKRLKTYIPKILVIIMLPFRTIINLILATRHLRYISVIFLFRDLLLDFNANLKDLKRESGIERLNVKGEKGILGLESLTKDIVDSPRAITKIASSIYLHGSGYQEAVPFLELGFTKYQEIIKQKTPHVPFKLITPAYVASIGHLTQLSILAKLEEVQQVAYCQKVIFYESSANEALLELYSTHFTLVKVNKETQRKILRELGEIMLPMGIFETKTQLLEYYSAWNFTEELYQAKNGEHPFLEIDRQNDSWYRKQLGLPEDAWFVTIHLREEIGKINRSTNNVDPKSYIKAIRFILDIGGYVIRLGNPSMTPMSSLLSHDAKFIDYAHYPNRSPKMDIFLLSRCRFLIGTASGPIAVPHDFGVPVLYTNATNVGLLPRWRGFCLPQTFQEVQSGRELTLRETLQSPVGWKQAPEFEGLRRRHNTPEEILSGTQTLLYGRLPNQDKEIRVLEIQSEFGLTSRAKLEPAFLDAREDYLA